jgi:hypothetical protein
MWQTDEPHVLFPLIMVATVIVTCVTIYVLCSQVFGPNVSLTELSYGGRTTELPWPGKIPMQWGAQRPPSTARDVEDDMELDEEEIMDDEPVDDMIE